MQHRPGATWCAAGCASPRGYCNNTVCRSRSVFSPHSSFHSFVVRKSRSFWCCFFPILPLLTENGEGGRVSLSRQELQTRQVFIVQAKQLKEQCGAVARTLYAYGKGRCSKSRIWLGYNSHMQQFISEEIVYQDYIHAHACLSLPMHLSASTGFGLAGRVERDHQHKHSLRIVYWDGNVWR